MLARPLKRPALTERRIERHREAVVLPFSRSKSAASQVDWHAKYPCTRMHGAAFEAEFYPAEETF